MKDQIKKLQQQLAEQQKETERWKAALDSAGDGMWDWNLLTNEVYLSDQWKKMLGFEPHEIQADIQEWEMRVHPDDLAQAKADVQNCLEGNTAFYENEYRLRCKNGSYKWILDRGRIIEHDPHGKPSRFIGTHIDNHNRKQLEEELAESNKELKFSQNLMSYIIEHANGAVAVHDRDLRYVYVSQRYLNDYRISDSDIIGRHHYDVFPDLPQKWRDVHQKALEGEVLSDDRDPFQRADGSLEWTRWECRPWFDADGNIGGIIVYTEVITDQIKAEQALTESEAKFRSLFENMALASCLHEIVFENEQAVNYRILDINSEYTEILGLSKNEVVGKLATEVYQVEKAPFIEIYGQVAQTGEPASFETYYAPIEKQLIVTASCPKPGFFSTVFGDITERKKMEEELTDLKEKLEQEVAEKTEELQKRVKELKSERVKLKASNQELEAFTYTVSHDLRAPLRAINGFSNFLLEDYGNKLDQEGMRYIETIRNNANKMDLLIIDLLNLSRISKTMVRHVDLNMKKIIQESYEEMATEEQKKQFEFHVSPLHKAKGDPALIRQVWDNLIGNALKYSEKSSQKKIQINAAVENNEIIYSIKDYGAGFNPAYVSKLFGIFQRLHRDSEFEGVGVGLAIVKRIITRHGGRVWGTGEENSGAQFFFSLPNA